MSSTETGGKKINCPASIQASFSVSKDQISSEPEGLSFTIKGTRYKDLPITLGALRPDPHSTNDLVL